MSLDPSRETCTRHYARLQPGDWVAATVTYREEWTANGCLRYRSVRQLIGRIERFEP